MIIEIRDENLGAGVGYGAILGLLGGSIVGIPIANSVIDEPKEEKTIDLSFLEKFGLRFWISVGGTAIGVLFGIEHAPAKVYLLESESYNPGNTFNTTPNELMPGIE